MRRLLRAILAIGIAAWAAGGTFAQTLADPTRPPSGFSADGGAAPAAAPGAMLVLQSVLIGDTARSAIISGEHVLLGQKIGGSRLVKVGETEVVLLEGKAHRTLKLFPAVDKRAAGASGPPDRKAKP